MARISTFDDWIDLFAEWRRDIGIDLPEIASYPFEAKYGTLKCSEIEYGDFRGQPKWERVLEIPDQRVRDALQNLIIYQGDTEFASVEQQRYLVDTAPGEYDRYALVRVMTEEMRHGFQMCHLLVNHFGHSGKIEAAKQLERRAFANNRLLGAFNQIVANWLDFYTYTDFVDRDGKYQLNMLSTSAFAPLARSMLPMLKEESFHLGTGHDGIKRILKAGLVPTDIIQKYLNKWISTAFDLFGVDNSSSAHWFYVWGLKGRFDEAASPPDPDKSKLNEHNRELYRQECLELVGQFNRSLPEGATPLVVPDLKFNRKIGQYASQCFTVDGQPVAPERYPEYSASVLPSEADQARLKPILATKGWIAEKPMPAAA